MKAQAALEFLTTYGWALLLITIMIGAIVYFGVVNPSSIVKEECISSNYPFECVDYSLDENGAFKLILKWVGEGELNSSLLQAKWICKDNKGNMYDSGPYAPIIITPAHPDSIEVSCEMNHKYKKGEMVKMTVYLQYSDIISKSERPQSFEIRVRVT